MKQRSYSATRLTDCSIPKHCRVILRSRHMRRIVPPQMRRITQLISRQRDRKLYLTLFLIKLKITVRLGYTNFCRVSTEAGNN